VAAAAAKPTISVKAVQEVQAAEAQGLEVTAAITEEAELMLDKL
jgi:hypothetical protein